MRKLITEETLNEILPQFAPTDADSLIERATALIERYLDRALDFGDRNIWMAAGERDAFLDWPVCDVVSVGVGTSRWLTVEPDAALDQPSIRLFRHADRKRVEISFTDAAGTTNSREIQDDTLAELVTWINANTNWTAEYVPGIPNTRKAVKLCNMASGSATTLEGPREVATGSMYSVDPAVGKVYKNVAEAMLVQFQSGFTYPEGAEEGNVPADLQQACALLCQELETMPEANGIQSEKIGDWSITYTNAKGRGLRLPAISNILSAYRSWEA